jgi:hypothetical protein
MTLSSILYDKLVRSYWEASNDGDVGRIYETYWEFRDNLFIIDEHMRNEIGRIEHDFRMKVPDSEAKVKKA